MEEEKKGNRNVGFQETVAKIKDPEKRFWAMRRAIDTVNGRVLFGTVMFAIVGAVAFSSIINYPENSELEKQQQENMRLIEEAKRKREGR